MIVRDITIDVKGQSEEAEGDKRRAPRFSERPNAHGEIVGKHDQVVAPGMSSGRDHQAYLISLSVSFIQMLKAFTPVAILLISAVLKIQKLNQRLVAIVLVCSCSRPHESLENPRTRQADRAAHLGRLCAGGIRRDKL